MADNITLVKQGFDADLVIDGNEKDIYYISMVTHNATKEKLTVSLDYDALSSEDKATLTAVKNLLLAHLNRSL